jgi:hypothetical protein
MFPAQPNASAGVLVVSADRKGRDTLTLRTMTGVNADSVTGAIARSKVERQSISEASQIVINHREEDQNLRAHPSPRRGGDSGDSLRNACIESEGSRTMKSYHVPFRQTVPVIVIVLVWGLAGFAPFAQAADQPEPLTTVQEEQGKGGIEGAGTVQERGVSKMAPLPPYGCSAEAGVCLCVGASNCEHMMQPTPCKRQKFCSGQTASSPPPLPPQQVPQNMARTSEGTLVICSCRSGP